MRFLRAGHSASRTFSLGMRARKPAAPVMVPLSVLEDYKALAAQVAQLNDARFDEAKARYAGTKTHFKVLEQVSADKVAKAIFERDMARGKVNARVLVEEALAELWRAWERLDADQQQQMCPRVKKTPFSGTEQLELLLGFPAVAAYLEVAEEDNGLARGVLVKSAGIMYPALCTPLHARAAGEQAGWVPAKVSSAIGENGRIAFAALLAFGGRNVDMYHPCGATVSVVLRVPPVLGLSATLKDIRDSAKLPAVEASVELGAAGSAEASGE